MPGGRAQFQRVPQAQFGPIKLPEAGHDERFLYLSEVLPTSGQAVEYADVGEGDTMAIFGLGTIGPVSARIALRKGVRVIGVDLVPERLALAAAWGVEVLDQSDLNKVDNVAEAVFDLTGGRGADATIDAVGMEAHGSPVAQAASAAVGVLPDALAKPAIDKLAVDRAAALIASIKAVRRGGTVSVSGVYGGEVEPLPTMEMFDRGIQMRMGQRHVKRWTDEILAVLEEDEDVLGVESLATHRLPLSEAPAAYEMFQKQADGRIKVVLKPYPHPRSSGSSGSPAPRAGSAAPRADGGFARRPRGAGRPR